MQQIGPGRRPYLSILSLSLYVPIVRCWYLVRLIKGQPAAGLPASTIDTADISTDETIWEDTQTDDDSIDWASSFPSGQGPLSSKEICKFLKVVKARKKPMEVAKKFNIIIHIFVYLKLKCYPKILSKFEKFTL